jgi:hypothetical protein
MSASSLKCAGSIGTATPDRQGATRNATSRAVTRNGAGEGVQAHYRRRYAGCWSRHCAYPNEAAGNFHIFGSLHPRLFIPVYWPFVGHERGGQS